MRILFMGTPDFAVPSLKTLVERGHDLCGVFTQPDRPKNRGMKLIPTPVKEYAMSVGIPVFQPEKLRDGGALAQIQALAPQLIVVAAYGRLLPDEILDYPAMGCINVHSSLLPRYRGAAPIHWAVLNGDKETGVTIMHMATELDSGDIIAQEATPISPDETAEDLHDRLALMGAELVARVVNDLAAGTAMRTPQNHSQATLAPMLSRNLSPMDWNRTAGELHNQVRGLYPWPGALAELGGRRCKVLSTHTLDGTTGCAPGTVTAAGRGGITVACGGGTLLNIDRLQGEGARPMSADDYLRGRPLTVGE